VYRSVKVSRDDRIEKPPPWPAFWPAGKLKHAPPKASAFHELSRAVGPFKQGRKTTSRRHGRPSADWQAKACPTFFHEVSRAEDPSQQATKPDGLSHLGLMSSTCFSPLGRLRHGLAGLALDCLTFI
jgi:hypothetical protein